MLNQAMLQKSIPAENRPTFIRLLSVNITALQNFAASAGYQFVAQ
jgi:hypothetical protein